ncbi:MAG: Crp/Fnr family transcriptional regulator [Rhodoferax sp.]|nr:Crp/Fnr family transcriptional regulator [Rhodoferax sp.]
MKTVISNLVSRNLNAREVLHLQDQRQMWRVQSGALRIDSAAIDEASRFMRLALPGDVIGVEQWVGTQDTLSYRALTPVVLCPVQASGPEVMEILMETVVVAHQRCREVVTLRTGPVSQRVKALLLMFAEHVSPDAKNTADCAVPNLADMAEVLDAAPETVSRVFSSMRRLDYLQDRKPHKARFNSLALRAQALIPGMTASSALQRSQLAWV